MVKEAARYAEELGLQLQLEYPNPTSIQHESGDVVAAGKLKVELRKCLERKLWKEVQDQNWHGKLISVREEDESFNITGCFLVAKRLESMVSFTNSFYLRGCMPAKRCTRL